MGRRDPDTALERLGRLHDHDGAGGHRLANISADERAYYAAQPLWLVLATDIALLAPIAAGIALLMRSATAVWLFAVGLAVLVFLDLYELIVGTSRMLANTGALVVTCVILVIAVLQLVYARRMKQGGVLR